MGEEDLPWLKQLCLKRYAHNYNPIETELWFKNTVLKAPLLFCPIRSDNAFCIAMLSCLPWLPNDFDCNIIFLCADDDAGWEALRLLRITIQWARNRKCKSWRLISDTDYDLSPLARRLGAIETSPRFVLRL